MKANKIAIFEGKRIRRYWDDEKELWCNASVISCKAGGKFGIRILGFGVVNS